MASTTAVMIASGSHPPGWRKSGKNSNLHAPAAPRIRFPARWRPDVELRTMSDRIFGVEYLAVDDDVRTERYAPSVRHSDNTSTHARSGCGSKPATITRTIGRAFDADLGANAADGRRCWESMYYGVAPPRTKCLREMSSATRRPHGSASGYGNHSHLRPLSRTT